MNKPLYKAALLLLLIGLQGCSSNGFHLRKNVTLSPEYNTIYLKGLASKSEFKEIFVDGLLEAGSEVTENEKLSNSRIEFSRVEGGRRVIAYTSDRIVREFLVFLKLEYSIHTKNDKTTEAPKHRIDIDRSYLYDPDFALGKAEEEKQVKMALYEEATRLILLKLKSSNNGK